MLSHFFLRHSLRSVVAEGGDKVVVGGVRWYTMYEWWEIVVY